jgi:tRNA A-37 threonylcarbamoyl transferase component Bud32
MPAPPDRPSQTLPDSSSSEPPPFPEPVAPTTKADFPSKAEGPAAPGTVNDGQPAGSAPPAGHTLTDPPPVADEQPLLPEVPGYEVLGVLGRGGMGVVYKARQKGLGRLVALKMILHADHAGRAERQRFQAEAEAIARLQHPHIVQVFEVGEHKGHPFFSLEFCPGGSLEAKLRVAPLLPRQAAALVETLSLAMSAAHLAGLVHRDLKPANVLLTRDGAPKITDFGLAKKLDEAGQTQSGAILGTPSYMAPEQARGQGKEVGPAADVYALGAILYDCLTGRPPFRADSIMETLAQVLADDPAPPSRLNPKVPRDLETICLKCLHKSPERRYASAEALADDLHRFLAGEAIRARPEGVLGKLGRTLRRRRVPLAVGLLVALALSAAGYVALQGDRAQRLAELRNAVEAGLAAEELTPAQLEELEGRIARLGELEPGPAAEARARALERFRKETASLLERPRLEPEDVERFERNAQALAARDPEAAAELRTRLRQRLHDWDVVFELRAPFAEAGKVFAAADVEVKGDRLTIRRGPQGGADTFALTRVPCSGNVELEAEFDESWESAATVGLALNAGGDQAATGAVPVAGSRAYCLVLSASAGPAEGAARTARTLGEARKGGRLTLEVWRNGVTLSRQAVEAPAGPLTLRFSREGEQLKGQVNGEAPLVFLDAFPLGRTPAGAFGLLRRPEARLTRLRARRQAPATTPSPLERADELFDRGRYDEALIDYQRQAQAPLTTPAGQESRYKAALCLAQRKRSDEADALLGQVASVPEGRWAPAAAIRLWQVRLEQNRFADAETAFASIASRYRFEDLVAVLPDDTRRRIIERQYAVSGNAGQFLHHDPDRLTKLERAAEAAAFLRLSLEEQGYIQQALMRAYQLAGRRDQALRSGRAFLERCAAAPPADRLRTAALPLFDYCWLLRSQGEARAGLAELDRWLFAAPGVYSTGEEWSVLSEAFAERARLQAALGDWEGAEKDLAECFRLMQGLGGRAGYALHSTAHLLRGFLLERRGDRAGAAAAWRAGSWKAWRDRLPREAQPVEVLPYHITTATVSLHHLILTALTDELTDAEAEEAVGQLVKGFAGKEAPPQFAAVAARFPPSALREMWKTPRGREYARRIAFRDLPYAESLRAPVLLLGAEIVRQEGFGGELSAEQDELVWQAASASYALYADGKVGTAQALQLGLAWKKGITGLLGWASVAPSLPAEVRGPLAYAFGHRLLRLKMPREAEDLFRSALADAPRDSPLRRLAQAELDRLKPK